MHSIAAADGRYVTDSASDISEVLPGVRCDIEKEFGRSSSLGELVGKTYFAQLLNIALQTSKHRNDHEYLKRLKSLLETLGFNDIRNAVAHPNRPFPECYWHRLAAVATDPSIDRLGLVQVIGAFRAAEAGKLEHPPADWLARQKWSIPNNLPTAFDHEITGLIGREKECRTLKRRLENRRFSLISLMGPGGTGKTALCLEMMRDMCVEPSALEWMEECVYVSAKTEWLTTAGITVVENAVESLEHVRKAIAAAWTKSIDDAESLPFSECVERFREKRVLLCLDNLETLLRDDAEEFESFYSELPADWRVLVTSRVAVDGATVIPVETMSMSAATRLAREYLANRGGDRLQESELSRIADATDCNPLGIRLVVDSYIAGAPLEEALSQSKERVLAFSYENLMNALPAASTEVLECLFAVDEPLTRAEIAAVLERTADDVADGILGLVGTSLITRDVSGDVERNGISSSVRELLLRHPRRPEVRERVLAKLRRNREAIAAIDRVGNDDPLSPEFIPQDAPDHVRVAAFEGFRAARRAEDAATRFRTREHLQQMLASELTHAVLSRALSRLYEALLDRTSSTDVLQLAVDKSAADPSTLLLLAEHRFNDRDLDGAITLTKPLIENGLEKSSLVSPRNASRLLRAHWLPAIWRGRQRDAIQSLQDWSDSGTLRTTKGCLYVAALKQIFKGETRRDQQQQLLIEMLGVLSRILDSEGYTAFVAHECMNALRHAEEMQLRSSLSTEAVSQVCGFMNRHLKAICLYDESSSINDEEPKRWIQMWSKVETGDDPNPLNSEAWRDIVGGGADESLGEYGYISAEVYHRPKLVNGKPKQFLFVRDREGQEYYLPLSSTNLSPADFERVKEGDIFQIRPKDGAADGRATPVRDAVFAS